MLGIGALLLAGLGVGEFEAQLHSSMRSRIRGLQGGGGGERPFWDAASQSGPSRASAAHPFVSIGTIAIMNSVPLACDAPSVTRRQDLHLTSRSRGRLIRGAPPLGGLPIVDWSHA